MNSRAKTALETLRSLKVSYHGEPVGTLALTREGSVAFSYDEAWLAGRFSISPFSLPLAARVFLSRTRARKVATEVLECAEILQWSAESNQDRFR